MTSFGRELLASLAAGILISTWLASSSGCWFPLICPNLHEPMPESSSMPGPPERSRTMVMNELIVRRFTGSADLKLRSMRPLTRLRSMTGPGIAQ